MTIIDLGRRLASGETSSADVVAAALEAAHGTADTVNAFAHIDTEGAKAAAQASDQRRRRGFGLGPLDGIPISVKDNLFVRGMPVRWGSAIFENHVAKDDDIAVERLREAGAVIIGKTNTPEFSLGGRTWSRVNGHTRNPLDLQLTPGGSSGGASASVAAGIVAAALGTDAGGSIRMPASYTGLYGLRPSNGAVPRMKGFPALALDYQVIGLLTASAADMHILFDSLSGPDVRDPASIHLGGASSRTGRRAGWLVTAGDEPVDCDVAARVRHSAMQLRDCGWSVAEVEFPCELARVRRAWATLTGYSVWKIVRDVPEWQSKVTPQINELAQKGSALLIGDFAQAMEDIAAVRQQVAVAFDSIDVLLTPTASSPAWPAELPFSPQCEGRPTTARTQSVFAGWVNTVGYPALSIPAAPHSDGRQVGVQLVARPGGDHLLLETAASLVKQSGAPTRALV